MTTCLVIFFGVGIVSMSLSLIFRIFNIKGIPPWTGPSDKGGK